MSNPPSGKRNSSGSKGCTEPKSIKPKKHVREYPNELFVFRTVNTCTVSCLVVWNLIEVCLFLRIMAK